MATGKVHVGDTHTDFQLLVQKTDVSGTNAAFDLNNTTSAIKMVFTDPSDNETTVTAVILNSPGTDGIIRYVNSTPSPVINTSGLWKYRAKLTLAAGGLFQSNDATFEVLG